MRSTASNTVQGVWVFGYGSIIWKVGFPYVDTQIAVVDGWVRRFWQGSHDHRGLPHAPGRVVTLVPSPQERCEGRAYLVDERVVTEVFEGLDHREKNGYERIDVTLRFRGGAEALGVVYVAPVNNHAFLGPAPTDAMVEQILTSVGPSGTNVEYLLELAKGLRAHQIDDPHVFELERLVRARGIAHMQSSTID